MPRAKAFEMCEQKYDIGDGVIVTITYRSDKRPRMVHNDRRVEVEGAGASLLRAVPPIDHVRNVAQIDATGNPAGFVSSSTLTDADLDAELQAMKDRGASVEEVEAVLAERNVATGPKPRASRGRDIAKAASKLRTISVETHEGPVSATLNMNGGVSN